MFATKIIKNFAVVCVLVFLFIDLSQCNEKGEKEQGSVKSLSRSGQIQDEDIGEAKDVCRNNNKVAIHSLKHMLHLISVINKNDSMCKKRYLSAIYELDPLLKMNRDSFCDEHAIAKIQQYHFRFIQPPKRANRRPTQFEPMPVDVVKEQLHPEPRKYTVEFDEHSQVLFAPIAVRHFFLKFALQVSYQCKKNLINNLQADAKRILSSDDFEVMQMFEDDSPIGQALAGGMDKIDFDNVLYIPELDGKLVKASGEEMQTAGREQHLHTKANQNSALFQMIHSCKNRLKPLYDKLIVPIVRLSKMGYDYLGQEGFSEREQQFLESSTLKNWLVVVHVCEIFRNTYLIREPTGEQPKRQRITLKDQLDKIEDSDDEHDEHEVEEHKAEEVEEEGLAKPISEEEQKEFVLEAKKEGNLLDEAQVLMPMDYELTIKNRMEDKLMIESEDQLDFELSRKQGYKNPFGFRGFLRKASSYLRKMLAKLDFERFAHYRRNSLFYSGLFNFLSACSNVASISVTLTMLFHG